MASGMARPEEHLSATACAILGELDPVADPQDSEAVGARCVDVPAHCWYPVMAGLASHGALLDWLSCVDPRDLSSMSPVAVDDSGAIGELQVVALVTRAEQDLLVRTVVGPEAQLDSVIPLFPSAAWHERESTEMFGIRFTGGDDRRLLLADLDVLTPLRRDFALTARMEKSWPGAAESGRRSRKPGVNPRWSI